MSGESTAKIGLPWSSLNAAMFLMAANRPRRSAPEPHRDGRPRASAIALSDTLAGINSLKPFFFYPEKVVNELLRCLCVLLCLLEFF